MIGAAGLATEGENIGQGHAKDQSNLRHKTVSTRGTFARLSMTEVDLGRNLRYCPGVL